MHRLISRALESSGFRQSVVATFGNYAGTILSAIALILFSRLLGPEAFGTFSAGFALTLLLSRLFDFGLNMALQRQIAQEHSERGAKHATTNLIQAIGIIRVITSLALAIVGWFWGPYFGQTVLHIDDPLVTQISIATVGISMGFDYLISVYQAHQKFFGSSILMIVQATIKLGGAGILLLTHTANVINSLVLYTVAPLSGIGIGMVQYRAQLFAPIKKTIKDLRIVAPVAKVGSIAIISAAFAEQIDVLFVKAMLTSYDTGLYAAAGRIAMFISLIGLSLGTVLSVRVARYHDKVHLDAYLKKAWLLSLGCIVVTLLAIPFGTLAIHFTVGSAYDGAIMPLTLLLISTALASAAMPYVALFYLFDRPQYYSLSGILTMVLLIGSDLILIPTAGLFGAGIAKILTRLIVFVFTLWYVHLSYKHHFAKNQSHD